MDEDINEVETELKDEIRSLRDNIRREVLSAIRVRALQ